MLGQYRKCVVCGDRFKETRNTRKRVLCYKQRCRTKLAYLRRMIKLSGRIMMDLRVIGVKTFVAWNRVMDLYRMPEMKVKEDNGCGG